MLNFQVSQLYPILLALAALYPVIWFLSQRLFPKDKIVYPPSPPKIPILGNIHQVGVILPHRSLWNLCKQYGPFMFLQFGIRKVYVIQSGDIIKELVKDHDIPVSNRPGLLPNEKLWYGLKGLITLPYGDQWKKLRNIFMNQLLHKKRAQSFNSIRDEEVAKMVETISKLSSIGEPVNLSRMFSLSAAGTVAKATFGEVYAHGAQSNRIVPILEEMEKLSFKFTIRDFVPWLAWINRLTGV
ncbi:cytochrome P450 736A117-like [Andrographis paniculata]|uniref:cytochrome P450 736A117-like n=1 Tax=Andrographis paniculata TaxID=175694 RepID=UPI0021E8AB71|nr:cytochrome P450 736A117-like [Andrographis paniculata]